jgi:hypothetical protein
MVAVAGSPTAPRLLARQRVGLLEEGLPSQPYHAAAEAGLDLEEGARLIAQVEVVAARCAEAGLRELTGRVSGAGCRVSGAAIVANDRSLPAELGRILGAHPLLHAAEGDLYEQALIEGAARAGLSVLRIAPGLVPLFAGVQTAGRTFGPPWQKDHKLAASAAMYLLEGART